MIQPSKKGVKPVEYPSETAGSKLAAQVRTKANTLGASKIRVYPCSSVVRGFNLPMF